MTLCMGLILQFPRSPPPRVQVGFFNVSGQRMMASSARGLRPATGGVLREILQNAPRFSDATYPDTVTANRLLWASSTNVIGDLATANNGLLVTNGSGVPSIGNTISGNTTVSC